MTNRLKTVVITGITGFIGSNLAEKFLQEGYQVIGIIRESSDLSRCQEFLHQIKIIYNDDPFIYQKIRELDQFSLVYCAWNGVESEFRDDWTKQAENIGYLVKILEILNESKLDKIIFLGSQAEYGRIDKIVKEDATSDLLSAYGVIKASSRLILEAYAKKNNINWIWLRVFSVFGQKESTKWLIPSLIQRMKNQDVMDFTSCEQKYAYMYIKDFSDVVEKIVNGRVVSGVYNLSGNNPIKLKTIIETIRNFVNPNFKLNFGVLPTRSDQSMILAGNTEKIQKQIGVINFTDFNIAIQETIRYYKDITND